MVVGILITISEIFVTASLYMWRNDYIEGGAESAAGGGFVHVAGRGYGDLDGSGSKMRPFNPPTEDL